MDYRFLDINPAFENLTGLKADDLRNHTVLEVMPGTEKHWIETYGKVALTGEPCLFENYSEALDKHFQVTAFRPASMQFATIFTDITARKKAESERVSLEKQLMQSQKLETVGTMVGGISHELNNVLQSMFLYGGLIQDNLEAGSEMYENMQQLLDDGDRARDLVNQILVFSRKSEMQLVAQQIHEIVLGALKFKRASLPPDITLVQNISRDCGAILCDRTQIHQVVINLCNNAEQAIGTENGTIEVTLNEIELIPQGQVEPSRVLQLTVTDSGCGMEAEIVDRIFDPFFTTKEIGKGTGLGLSVIYGIVQIMGGEIKVTSVKGEGSTFKIYIPLANIDELDQADGATEGERSSLKSFLLVDDEESILLATQTALERKGFNIETASGGEQALKLFVDNPQKYDCIVTDLSMPQMSGLELIREIRNVDTQIPIILSTGLIEVDDMKGYAARGASGFIQKPWNVDELLATVGQTDK